MILPCMHSRKRRMANSETRKIRPIPAATRKRNLVGFATAALILAASGIAHAQERNSAVGVYLSGAERIDLSDRIRVNSQRISASVCLIDAGLKVDENRKIITDAIADTELMLAALTDGNASLGVETPEDGRKMLAALRGVSLQWDPFKTEAQTRLGQGQPAPGPDYVSRQNLNLMHVTKNLTSQVINDYSIPPALLQNDASTILFATRQRSLSQQIAKEACGILTGNTIMGNMPRLKNAVARFDATFSALLTGFPAAGISAPATPQIKAELEAAQGEWNSFKAELENVTQDGDPQNAEALFTKLNSLLAKIDTVIPHYVEESKAGI